MNLIRFQQPSVSFAFSFFFFFFNFHVVMDVRDFLHVSYYTFKCQASMKESEVRVGQYNKYII